MMEESPHISVLVKNYEFLCTHLKPRIKAYLPPLVEAGVLSKGNEGRIERAPNSKDQVNLLLGYLRHYDADRFVRFLQVLKSLVEDDKDAWSCLERLTTSVENARLSLDPRLDSASIAVLSEISSFVSQVKAGSLPTQQTQLTQVSAATHIRLIDETRVIINTSNKDFYSSLHGVSVSFSSCAFPPDLKEFKFQLSVYDSSCFKLPEDFELCTAVVRLSTIPEGLHFFQNGVSVSIPHCAVITCLSDVDSLSIRALSDADFSASSDFSKGEEIRGDFGDGYHARFTVSHFTGYAGVVDKKKRKRKWFPDSLLNTRHEQECPSKKSNTSPEAAGIISACPPQYFSPFKCQAMHQCHIPGKVTVSNAPIAPSTKLVVHDMLGWCIIRFFRKP